jgi:hypothetical protein
MHSILIITLNHVEHINRAILEILVAVFLVLGVLLYLVDRMVPQNQRWFWPK